MWMVLAEGGERAIPVDAKFTRAAAGVLSRECLAFSQSLTVRDWVLKTAKRSGGCHWPLLSW